MNKPLPSPSNLQKQLNKVGAELRVINETDMGKQQRLVVGFLFPVEGADDGGREETELDRFIAMTALIMTVDPVKWWCDQGTREYPRLARRYLTAPGTFVLSERVFSTAGNV